MGVTYIFLLFAQKISSITHDSLFSGCLLSVCVFSHEVYSMCMQEKEEVFFLVTAHAEIEIFIIR